MAIARSSSARCSKGRGPGVFCDDEYTYLRMILPTSRARPRDRAPGLLLRIDLPIRGPWPPRGVHGGPIGICSRRNGPWFQVEVEAARARPVLGDAPGRPVDARDAVGIILGVTRRRGGDRGTRARAAALDLRWPRPRVRGAAGDPDPEGRPEPAAVGVVPPVDAARADVRDGRGHAARRPPRLVGGGDRGLGRAALGDPADRADPGVRGVPVRACTARSARRRR